MLDDWSPDGAHLIIHGLDGHHVLSASGAPLWGFGAWYVAWLDSNTISAAGDGLAGAARYPVRFYDISGSQTGQIPTLFEQVVYAPGHQVFAGTYSFRGDLSQGDTFSIWDGTSVSKTYEGHPVAWSSDASRLAVLVPPWGPSRPGMEGDLAIFDANGQQLMKLSGWEGPTVPQAPYSFSPDGRYLAACLTNDPNKLEVGTVVDTQTGAVTRLGGACAWYGRSAWSDEAALYTRDSSGQPVRWTRDDGVVPVDGTDSTDGVIPAPNGNLAIWSSNAPRTLQLLVDGDVQEHRLPDNVIGVGWRPDSQAVAVIYGRSDGSGNSALTIINV